MCALFPEPGDDLQILADGLSKVFSRMAATADHVTCSEHLKHSSSLSSGSV